jgi:serine/threonine-protein kinase
VGITLWMAATLPRHAGTVPGTSVRRLLLPTLDPPLYAVERPPIALSPDGRRIAFVTGTAGGSRIVVQHLDKLGVQAIQGTEGGVAPFFSPDGESLGFFTRRSLMRVDIGGGPPIRLAGTPPVTRGGVWSTDGYIYFAPSQSAGILRISAGGGSTEPASEPVEAAATEGHVWPDLSPDGSLLLYVERHGDSYGEARIMARSLRTRTTQLVVAGGTFPRFVSASRIVFARESTVFALEIDPVSGAPRGQAQAVLDGVRMDPLMGSACITVARDGTMAYIAGDARPAGATLLWVTAAGRETPAFPEERPFLMPAISPDGESVAITIESVHQDLWRVDLERGVLTRLTSSPAEDFGGVWSPDGQRLAYTSVRGGRRPSAFVKPAGALDGETLLGENLFPSGWTTEGAVIASKEEPAVGQTQIRIITDRGALTPIAESRFDRFGATLSPDGRHLAFVSTETGEPEVFVSPWPTPVGAQQASLNGGTSPVWARDSRTLYYRKADGLFAVAVGPPPAHRLSSPRLLFRGTYHEPGRPDWPRNYDVARDGRFLMIRETSTPALRDVVVVFNWRGDRLAPSAPSSDARPAR